jgi:type III secretion protein Q
MLHIGIVIARIKIMDGDITPRLLNLEKHTRESIQLNNQISLGRGYKKRFQIKNRIGHIELFTPKTNRDNQLKQRVPLVINGHPGWIALNDLFFRNRLTRFLPKDNLADLPSEICIAVIEAALDYELGLFEKVLGFSIEIAGIHQQQKVGTDDIRILFSLTWEPDNNPIEGYLFFKSETLPLFLKAAEKTSTHINHNWELLSKTIRFEIGSTQLSTVMLRDITSGDILFLDHCPLIQENTVFIPVAPKLSLKGQVQGNRIILDGRWKKIEMNEKKPELIDIDDLQINLVFDVGERQILLRELKTLQPGYSFTLDNPLQQPVTIRANGHPIGNGELIEINNHIGVRVLELSGKFDG